MNRRPYTVLYVEDTPVNVVVMSAMFEHLPECHLVVARTGAEAWALANMVDPDLLLLDINLPDCRGDDLLRRLRMCPACEQARAVAVTAEVGFDAVPHGFDERWLKPLDLMTVVHRVRALVSAGPTLRAQASSRPHRSPQAPGERPVGAQG